MRTLLLFLLLLHTPLSQALQATVDRASLVMGESFTLSLTSDNVQAIDSPNLLPLERDFDILGTTTQQQYSVLNGKASATKTWHVSLMAKREGRLTVPALQLGKEHSETLEIEVFPYGTATDLAGSTEKHIFIEARVANQKPFINSQVLYTIKVFIHDAAKVDNLLLSEPQLSAGQVVKLDKDLRYQTRHQGQLYQVIERRYAVFPQQTGVLTISGAQLNGNKLSSRNGKGHNPFSVFNDPFFSSNLFTQAEPFRLPVEDVSLNVQARPASYPKTDWLAASDLQLQEAWAGSLDSIKMGEPITRTITLTAKGLTGPQLPPLPLFELPTLKQYPNQPSIETNTNVEGVIGSRVETTAFVPTEAGELTLPAVEILWWDTVNNRLQVASLAARTLSVKTAADFNPLAIAKKQQQQATATDNEPVAEAIGTAAAWLSQWQKALPWVLTVVFALLWLGSQWRKQHAQPPSAQARATARRSKKTVVANSNKRPPEKAASISSDKKASKKAIKAACHNNDALLTAELLLNYVKSELQLSKVSSLATLAQLSNNPALQAALLDLEKAVYSNSKTDWQGQHLAEHLSSVWRLQAPAVKNNKKVVAPAWQKLHPEED